MLCFARLYFTFSHPKERVMRLRAINFTYSDETNSDETEIETIDVTLTLHAAALIACLTGSVSTGSFERVCGIDIERARSKVWRELTRMFNWHYDNGVNEVCAPIARWSAEPKTQ